MRIFIFANEKDHSILLVENELAARGIPYFRYRYRELSIRSGRLFVKTRKFAPEPDDKIFMRSPFNTPLFTREYSSLARFIAQTYPKHVVFDQKAYQFDLPFYQDKLYQGLVYDRMGIPTPKIWYFSNRKRINWKTFSFPIVLKKRKSARSRANFLVHSKEELERHLETNPIHHFILQEYIHIKKDIRINVLKGNVLYGMERMVHIHEDNRLAVKGAVPLPKPSKKLSSYAVRIAKQFGADFAGIDFLEATNGKTYVIETNLSPQFNRAQDIMPVKTAEMVVDALIK